MAHAFYERTEGNAEKVQVYIRRSPITKSWYVLETTPESITE